MKNVIIQDHFVVYELENLNLGIAKKENARTELIIQFMKQVLLKI